jgi:plastocyanin
MEDRNHELNERRQLLQRFGRIVLGASMIGLSACLPRESHRYEVNILLSQSRSHFEPGGLEIPAGSTVVWQNRSIYPQTVTCDPAKARGNPNVSLPQSASPWDSGVLYPGQTWEYKFSTAGEYLYFSQLAEGDGPYLIGTVKVT